MVMTRHAQRERILDCVQSSEKELYLLSLPLSLPPSLPPTLLRKRRCVNGTCYWIFSMSPSRRHCRSDSPHWLVISSHQHGVVCHQEKEKLEKRLSTLDRDISKAMSHVSSSEQAVPSTPSPPSLTLSPNSDLTPQARTLIVVHS